MKKPTACVLALILFLLPMTGTFAAEVPSALTSDGAVIAD